jgi:hypothetical protein
MSKAAAILLSCLIKGAHYSIFCALFLYIGRLFFIVNSAKMGYLLSLVLLQKGADFARVLSVAVIWCICSSEPP